MGLSTGSGVRQWVFQRFSNVIIIVFAVVLAVTLGGDLTYQSLSNLMAQGWFKVYLTFTLIVVSLNSVLSGWQVVGDYARKVHLPSWVLMGVVCITTLIYFIVAMTLIF